jgi:hypothetical protein
MVEFFRSSTMFTTSYVLVAPSDTDIFRAGLGIRANCTVPGNVTLKAADGSTYIWPLVVGVNDLDDGVVQVLATGYTATAVFYNLI